MLQSIILCDYIDICTQLFLRVYMGCLMIWFAAKSTANGESWFTSCRLAQHRRTPITAHLTGGVAIYYGCGITPRAFDIEEIRIRTLYQTTSFVLHALCTHCGIAQIGVEETHYCYYVISCCFYFLNCKDEMVVILIVLISTTFYVWDKIRRVYDD